MDVVFTIVFTIVFICTLAASLRFAIIGSRKDGKIPKPDNRFVLILTSEWWFLSLLLLLPWHLGEFARGEISCIPWRAFMQGYWRHGIEAGFLRLATVLTADLWLLWIPGKIWISAHSDADKRTRLLVRIVNLLGGVVLVTRDNPVYSIMGWVFDVGR